MNVPKPILLALLVVACLASTAESSGKSALTLEECKELMVATSHMATTRGFMWPSRRAEYGIKDYRFAKFATKKDNLRGSGVRKPDEWKYLHREETNEWITRRVNWHCSQISTIRLEDVLVELGYESDISTPEDDPWTDDGKHWVPDMDQEYEMSPW